MNKLVYGIVALIFIVVVGVGAYFVVNRKAPDTAGVPSEQPLVELKDAVGEGVETLSFKDIFTRKQNSICSFSDSETDSVGTVFIGNGNAKIDFQSGSPDTVVSHMILLNSEDAYMWIEGETQGIKTSFSEVSRFSATAEDNPLDINKAVDYECYPWDVDEDQFSLPEEIDFQDIGSIFKNAVELQNQL